MFNITFKSSIKNDLSKINRSDIKYLIDKIETELSDNPFKYPMLSGEFKGLRKFRIGDYRIIYTLDDSNIIILKIAHRKDVYKKK